MAQLNLTYRNYIEFKRIYERMHVEDQKALKSHLDKLRDAWYECYCGMKTALSLNKCGNLINMNSLENCNEPAHNCISDQSTVHL